MDTFFLLSRIFICTLRDSLLFLVHSAVPHTRDSHLLLWIPHAPHNHFRPLCLSKTAKLSKQGKRCSAFPVHMKGTSTPTHSLGEYQTTTLDNITAITLKKSPFLYVCCWTKVGCLLQSSVPRESQPQSLSTTYSTCKCTVLLGEAGRSSRSSVLPFSTERVPQAAPSTRWTFWEKMQGSPG